MGDSVIVTPASLQFLLLTAHRSQAQAVRRKEIVLLGGPAANAASLAAEKSPLHSGGFQCEGLAGELRRACS